MGSNILILEDTLEQWHHSQKILSDAGYRGLTHHQTKEDAKAAAEDMMAKVVDLDPSIE